MPWSYTSPSCLLPWLPIGQTHWEAVGWNPDNYHLCDFVSLCRSLGGEMQRVYLKGPVENLWPIISYLNLSWSLKICTTKGFSSRIVLLNIFILTKSNACMMPLHFKCTKMFYVAILEIHKQCSGNQEGGTNFTWRVSKPSGVGKILNDPSEERKKGMLCRGYRMSHEKE